MRPRIGVLPLYNAENETIWMNPLYTLGIEDAGGMAAVLGLSGDAAVWEAQCQCFDGFVFTGGQDIDPAIYGQEKLPQCSYQAPYRDAQERWMLLRLRELGKPVLGVCRGIQIMNAVFGGTLFQDLPTQRPSPVCHLQDRPFDVPVHQVAVTPGTLLRRLTGLEHLSVNSMHHQAVDRAAPDFIVSARASDGLAEAIELPGHPFFLGVQWHPEHLWQRYDHGRALWKGLVEAAEELGIRS